MNETTILLSPSPGAPQPDFLATVEPLVATTTDDADLPFEVVLDGYTRDKPMASAAADSNVGWKTVWLKSVDGRRKLPGFVKYLQDRKKSAVGKFDATSDAGQTRALFVVPFEQPTPPAEPLSVHNLSVDDVIFVKYILDERCVPRPPQQKQQSQRQQVQPQRRQQPPETAKQPKPAASAAPPPRSKSAAGGVKSGFLGNLLGAQRRTDEHLSTVPARKKKVSAVDGESGAGGGGGAAVIAKFRSDTEQALLDFRRDATRVCAKVPVSLAKIARDLPLDQREKVTMEVLKYIVFEQAEEIGEDKWVAAKEPSEFMDEIVIAVYKEGHAPPDVLEDLMKGDLPDEIRGQQRAMRESKLREEAKKERKQDELRLQQTLGSGRSNMDLETLNVNKRDRRTIEEIQRDMIEENKRAKR